MQNFESFANRQGQPCFHRIIGISEKYLQEIEKLDSVKNQIYLRMNQFQILSDKNQIQQYQENLEDYQKQIPEIAEMLKLYHQSVRQFMPTIERNLLISVLFWYDLYLKNPLSQTGRKKLVCSGKIGYKEYLFCYLAYLKGCDVLLLLPEGELNISEILLKQSQAFTIGQTGSIHIPEYHPKKPEIPNRPQQKINVVHPDRKKQNTELSSEALARMAKSVVMIAVYDKDGNFTGAGSGIAISRDGYILTNLHVVGDGQVYAVRLENDEQVYPSCQIIKYHTQFNLAVIKIEKNLEPLRIYDGRMELVRGQKVIAIGSPMGLFNSVSDGIIAGFRKSENQEYIQFTAAVSDGSCGGALLNTYGEVIGINTAHIIKGENMNLAVSYKQILPFILGFLR
ncbi:MAG: trypsin-like peptidase domain-containing protein [Oscillospiraceae bacterium]|nr:trypsin-like peptidase domain-containing protein [Oscillospiraceae bacterium]